MGRRSTMTAAVAALAVWATPAAAYDWSGCGGGSYPQFSSYAPVYSTPFVITSLVEHPFGPFWPCSATSSNT